MLDVFGFSSPQQSNYQEFYGGGTTRTWVKPRGVSMVRFMLIGSGGCSAASSTSNGMGGGGSGAVTSWIGPAIFVPDSLFLQVGASLPTSLGGGTATYIAYVTKAGNLKTLLTASEGANGSITAGGIGGAAMTNNFFGASGIFNSVAGQDGGAGGATSGGASVAASTTTFLSGGAGGSGAAANIGGSVTPNYGYLALPATTAGGSVKGADGYFITQPILVGCGGAGGSTSTGSGTSGGNGGIGCGGGGTGEDATTQSRGGNGAVFIWAW